MKSVVVVLLAIHAKKVMDVQICHVLVGFLLQRLLKVTMRCVIHPDIIVFRSSLSYENTEYLFLLTIYRDVVNIKYERNQTGFLYSRNYS